jgi:hypothetical protein
MPRLLFPGTCLALCLATGLVAGDPNLKPPQNPAPAGPHPADAAMLGPVFNQDTTQFFFERSASEISARQVDDYIDQLADSGVRTFVSNVNAMRANYPSRVWETDWTGYDPKGPDDQPILCHLSPAGVATTRRRLDSAKRLADLGVNFHQVALARCRARGIGAWVSVRMNDMHDCLLEDAPLLSTFYKAQRAANQLRSPHRGPSWSDRELDWERPEVQEHYFKLVMEQLDTLDLDGLELDWMRFPYHFRPGRELAGGRIITDWMWRVRHECDRTAARLGHPVRLGVRVPSRPETARRCGLDAVAWAHAGLVDVVVVTPFWATAEFDLPMLEWKRLLAGTKAQLAGGLEIRYQPVPDGPATMMSAELATGAAMAVLQQGGDLVYLFNYFPGRPEDVKKTGVSNLMRSWGGPERYREVVRAMQSAEALDRLPRVHAITYRDIRAPGEAQDNALPATDHHGQDMPWPPGCAFRLPTGPRPTGRAVVLTLEFAPGTTAPEQLHVYVNSTECAVAPTAHSPVLTYAVPGAVLEDEAQVIEVLSREKQTFTIVRVEMSVAAK